MKGRAVHCGCYAANRSDNGVDRSVGCQRFPAGNHAGYKEIDMISYRNLAIRNDRGHIQEPRETYSSAHYVEINGAFAPAPDSQVVGTWNDVGGRTHIRVGFGAL
jgi:hypothetical protein